LAGAAVARGAAGRAVGRFVGLPVDEGFAVRAGFVVAGAFGAGAFAAGAFAAGADVPAGACVAAASAARGADGALPLPHAAVTSTSAATPDTANGRTTARTPTSPAHPADARP
jgi:hypothetical protein